MACLSPCLSFPVCQRMPHRPSLLDSSSGHRTQWQLPQGGNVLAIRSWPALAFSFLHWRLSLPSHGRGQEARGGQHPCLFPGRAGKRNKAHKRCPKAPLCEHAHSPALLRCHSPRPRWVCARVRPSLAPSLSTRAQGSGCGARSSPLPEGTGPGSQAGQPTPRPPAPLPSDISLPFRRIFKGALPCPLDSEQTATAGHTEPEAPDWPGRRSVPATALTGPQPPRLSPRAASLLSTGASSACSGHSGCAWVEKRKRSAGPSCCTGLPRAPTGDRPGPWPALHRREGQAHTHMAEII